MTKIGFSTKMDKLDIEVYHYNKVIDFGEWIQNGEGLKTRMPVNSFSVQYGGGGFECSCTIKLQLRIS
ncbi:Uncharacterized protein TCM_003573 [Theobroma cacao]|uniref:Uncharacterized protein n=1 Tax=Theobroma cacao TaxID=3641 RepID=A0A061DN35_THECC|nr:Uncharacterized protein TCM_003573 [Theobroma cacao]